MLFGRHEGGFFSFLLIKHLLSVICSHFSTIPISDAALAKFGVNAMVITPSYSCIPVIAIFAVYAFDTKHSECQPAF